MANLSLIKFTAFLAFVVLICEGFPNTRLRSRRLAANKEHPDHRLVINQRLRDIIYSLRESAPLNSSAPLNLSDNKDQLYSNETKIQDNLEVDENSTLPILIHKADELSGIKFPTISDTDKSNPFIRTKRSSTCQVPANLTQVVQNLNSRLNSNQLVGLNPQTQSRNTIPAGQPSQCPNNTTNKWWPRAEVNLRSTCPWNLTEVDLGENAFPRYINKAVCLCIPCIGSETMRCAETKQIVSYLYRQGCQDGLAVMEQRNITVTVGCHCVTAAPQSGTIRPGPMTQ